MLIGLLPKEGGNLNIHVGNLAREVTEQELRQAFEPFGQVAAVRIVTDRYSGVSRGFAFVEMPDRTEARAGIEGLNMKELAGRTLDVSEARSPREARMHSRPHGSSRQGRSGSRGRVGRPGGRGRRGF